MRRRRTDREEEERIETKTNGSRQMTNGLRQRLTDRDEYERIETKTRMDQDEDEQIETKTNGSRRKRTDGDKD